MSTLRARCLECIRKSQKGHLIHSLRFRNRRCKNFQARVVATGEELLTLHLELRSHTETQGPAEDVGRAIPDTLQWHRVEWVYYDDDKKDWRAQREKIAQLEKWMLESVSPHLAEVACGPQEGVPEWYVNLKNSTGVTPDVEIRAARDKHLAVLRQTSRPPKDVKAWVRSWEEALTKARTVGVKMVETAIDWWDAFSGAVMNFGYVDWARSYNIIHKERIAANTIDYWVVTNDFMDCLRLSEHKSRTVAKGAFPTFGGHEDH